MKTNKEISYSEMPFGEIAIIPKGTKVIKANNIHGNKYWAEKWENMNEQELSWYRNYGFLINANDVEE